MHAQFQRSLDETLVEKEQSYWWQKFEDIQGRNINYNTGSLRFNSDYKLL
jgi:hypothetical protein